MWFDLKPMNLTIDEQLVYLTKGLAEIIREDDLRERLIRAKERGCSLRVKVGFDPTAPDLHLGHTVVLRKMKHFQNLGNQVIFLIGDATGLIGDPSGRNVTRPQMTTEEIEANAETYKRQVFKILDPAKTEIRFNSSWLMKFSFEDLINLCSRYTVARVLERDDFSRRFKGGQPISVHELLYPLTQAYDSVALEADVEMGGTDQKFNLLVGREIQREFGQVPQIVATLPLLEGLDGVQKMSKSLGNYIGINEAPELMYRKVMQISDELMYRYYELLTDASLIDIRTLRDKIQNGELHPMQAKMDLAASIVTDFHSAAEAQNGAEAFRQVVQMGQVPDNVSIFKLPEGLRDGYTIRIDKLLREIKLCASGSDANRKLREGAVTVNGLKHHEMSLTISPMDSELTLQVGKKWAKVTI